MAVITGIQAPRVQPLPAPPAHTAVPRGYKGAWWTWLTTVDAKRIGILYGVSAFIFFLIAGVEAMLIRIQLWQPDNKVINADLFNQLFTMHGTAMIFLVVMPLGAAFFNYVVPLMIGARDVAFPRLNAWSYWVFIAGGILLHISYMFGGAPNVGWFGYANLTEVQFNQGHGVDFWLLGLQLLGFASLAAAFNFAITIINLRAPGMRLMRMPPFVWMTLITTFLMILAFPVLTVALIELMFDRFFATNFFQTGANAAPLLWVHLFWIFGHPEVYILILPAMGIISEVVTTFSRKPLFGYSFVIFSGITIAFMGFGVWAHHMFTVGLGPIGDAVFAVFTMLIAIPTGVKVLNWMATMWGGSLNLKSPLYFAFGFISMFILGGISGIMHAVPPADLQQHGTYFVVAHLHYVLFGGSMFGLFAGMHYWYPKFTGRMLNERLAKLTFWTMFVGFNITFMPMHWTGLLGMPRRVYTYSADLGVTLLNQMSTIGSFILSFSILLFMWNAFTSLRRGAIAGDDPWDGSSLEWATTSPPPVYNFATIPTVVGREALWALKYPNERAPHHGDEQALTPLGGTAAAEVTRTNDHFTPGAEAAGQHPPTLGRQEIPMPRTSWWPITVALGLLLLLSGLIFTLAMSGLGLALMFIGIAGWSLEPASGEPVYV